MHGENRSLPQAAVHCQRAKVQFDNTFRKGQAEPMPCFIPDFFVLGTVEFMEYQLLVLR